MIAGVPRLPGRRDMASGTGGYAPHPKRHPGLAQAILRPRTMSTRIKQDAAYPPQRDQAISLRM